MDLILHRNAHTKFGTFGELRVGASCFYTVEQDWENNKPNVSCVPNGVYTVEPFSSKRHGDSLIFYNRSLGIGKFEGEAKRFGCLIHTANLASELEGCIAPGTGLGFYKNQWCVTRSGIAVSQIIKVLDKGPHKLIISSDFPNFKETV